MSVRACIAVFAAILGSAHLARANDPGPGNIQAARAFAGQWTMDAANAAVFTACDVRLADVGGYGSFDAAISKPCRARFPVLGEHHTWSPNPPGFQLRLRTGEINFEPVSHERFEGEYLITDPRGDQPPKATGQIFAMTRARDPAAETAAQLIVLKGIWTLKAAKSPSVALCSITFEDAADATRFPVNPDKACAKVAPFTRQWASWEPSGMQAIILYDADSYILGAFSEIAEGGRFAGGPDDAYLIERQD